MGMILWTWDIFCPLSLGWLDIGKLAGLALCLRQMETYFIGLVGGQELVGRQRQWGGAGTAARGRTHRQHDGVGTERGQTKRRLVINCHL